MESTGISLSDAIAYMPDNAGYFSWKYRVYEADVINYYWLRCPNNTRAMRYAEVLLLAAEASLQSGNASKAVDYVNKVRNRAQLPALGSVSMDDIKKEKRLELWMEGCRYQDLIRWGDAATVLAKEDRKGRLFIKTVVSVGMNRKMLLLVSKVVSMNCSHSLQLK